MSHSLINIPENHLYNCYQSTEEFSEAEKYAFDAAFSENTIGVDWWYVIERGLCGADNYPLHLFFYDSEHNVTGIFSGQYFPALSLVPYVEIEQLSLQHQKEVNYNDYACLMIHAFSSVSSLWYAKQQSLLPKIDLFINEFQQQNPLHVTLIRNITDQSLLAHFRNRNSQWYTKHGLPRYVSNLSNCSTIEEYLKQNVISRKRRNKLRASMRKLDLNSNYTIHRISGEDALRPYVTQIMELKRDTYKRNESRLSIPLMENSAYFYHILATYKNKAYFYILQDGMLNVIGFLLTVSSEKFARAISIGIKLPEGREVDAWYTLQLHMFSALTEHGIVAVNLGLGHGQLKTRIGSVCIPLYTGIRFNSALFDWDAGRILAPRFRTI